MPRMTEEDLTPEPSTPAGYFQMGDSAQLNCETCGARVQKAEQTLTLHRDWHAGLGRDTKKAADKAVTDAAWQVGGTI